MSDDEASHNDPNASPIIDDRDYDEEPPDPYALLDIPNPGVRYQLSDMERRQRELDDSMELMNFGEDDNDAGLKDDHAADDISSSSSTSSSAPLTKFALRNQTYNTMREWERADLTYFTGLSGYDEMNYADFLNYRYGVSRGKNRSFYLGVTYGKYEDFADFLITDFSLHVLNRPKKDQSLITHWENWYIQELLSIPAFNYLKRGPARLLKVMEFLKTRMLNTPDERQRVIIGHLLIFLTRARQIYDEQQIIKVMGGELKQIPPKPKGR
jgi:hypothetical protein